MLEMVDFQIQLWKLKQKVCENGKIYHKCVIFFAEESIDCVAIYLNKKELCAGAKNCKDVSNLSFDHSLARTFYVFKVDADPAEVWQDARTFGGGFVAQTHDGISAVYHLVGKLSRKTLKMWFNYEKRKEEGSHEEVNTNNRTHGCCSNVQKWRCRLQLK